MSLFLLLAGAALIAFAIAAAVGRLKGEGMMRKMGLIAAVAVVCVSVPASAAPGGTTARALYDMGKCIVRKDRKAAMELMSSLPLTGDANLSGSVGGASSCLNQASVPANAVTVRGAIAQALFIRDFNEFGVDPRPGANLASYQLPIEAGLYRWSDCVVRQDADAITILLRTPVGSRREAQLLERIKPQMEACLPTTERLAIAPSQLRSVLAQSAYNVAYRYWTNQLSARLESK